VDWVHEAKDRCQRLVLENTVVIIVGIFYSLMERRN
jgi:hypothetical protein